MELRLYGIDGSSAEAQVMKLLRGFDLMPLIDTPMAQFLAGRLALVVEYSLTPPAFPTSSPSIRKAPARSALKRKLSKSRHQSALGFMWQFFGRL